MTEAIKIEADVAVPKKAPGWPKGKPRPKKTQTSVPPAGVKAAADRAEERSKAGGMMARMKSRPNWESEDFQGVGLDHVDRLKIPDEVIQALHRDGIALQWVTRSVRGMETPQELSKMTRGGWTPVHNSDFDGILDGMFNPKGSEDVVAVEDCMLVARPAEIQARAKMMERREAMAPVRIVEQQIGRGLPVAGGDHPNAVRGNRSRSSWERIEIPE